MALVRAFTCRRSLSERSGSFARNFSVSPSLICSTFFRRLLMVGTTWSELAELEASNGETTDIFGRASAIDGDTVVIGADWHDVGGVANAGMAYVYDISGLDLPEGACCTNNTCAATTQGLCEYFGGVWQGVGVACADITCEAPCAADVNGDGSVAVDDLLEVIGAWGPCH